MAVGSLKNGSNFYATSSYIKLTGSTAPLTPRSGFRCIFCSLAEMRSGLPTPCFVPEQHKWHDCVSQR